MKNVLVTGSSGFLGQHLIAKLRLRYPDIKVVGCNSKVYNLCDSLGLASLIENPASFDHIFHCAAVTKAGDYSSLHPGSQWESNQLINTNIMMFWRKYQPQAKMVTFGSSCGYSPQVDDKREYHYFDGQVDPYFYAYGNVKRLLLVGLQSYAKEFGLQYSYFIPSVFYGPGFRSDDGHFIYDLIRKIHAAKHSGIAPKLIGSGYQRRGLIYVEDAVNIILDLCIVSGNDIINLTSQEDLTIREYAKIICSILDYDYNCVEYDTNEYAGVESKRLNNSKIEAFALTSFEDGLKATTEYYINSLGGSNG